jgi:integrase/recombinase XerD
MKPTDFAQYITEFLSNYLPKQKNVSKNTICSYRDTFRLLINFCQEMKKIPVERITLKILSKELVVAFLEWLEINRACSISTRNQRLAAIHSFFRYVQEEEPAGIFNFQQITSIPIKRTNKTVVDYLTPDAIKLLLEQPDKYTKKGRRDLTLMSVLYDSGARVQELIDIRVRDITLQFPAVITLSGKGNKTRRVPIMKNTAYLLQNYLLENKLDHPSKNECPLFLNNQGRKLTRKGIAYIISKYVISARQSSVLLPAKVKVHMIRHSKAMHLLQAEINLIYIRDFLGHTDVKTTEIYAKADIETKREAIEKVHPELINSNLPDWSKDHALISWLSQLK